MEKESVEKIIEVMGFTMKQEEEVGGSKIVNNEKGNVVK